MSNACDGPVNETLTFSHSRRIFPQTGSYIHNEMPSTTSTLLTMSQ